MKRKVLASVMLFATAALLVAFFVAALNILGQINNEDNEASGAVLGWILLIPTHFSWLFLAVCYVTFGILLLTTKRSIIHKRLCLVLWIVCLVALPFCIISAMATFALAEFAPLLTVLQIVAAAIYAAIEVGFFVVWFKIPKEQCDGTPCDKID